MLANATIIGWRAACQASSVAVPPSSGRSLAQQLPPGRCSPGHCSPRLATAQGRYWGVAPVCTEVPALSELEGTPMMAAPSRAAAAVTASRAVFKFTANLHLPQIASEIASEIASDQSRAGSKGHLPAGQLRAPYRGRSES